jgi:hypothetical protein
MGAIEKQTCDAARRHGANCQRKEDCMGIFGKLFKNEGDNDKTGRSMNDKFIKKVDGLFTAVVNDSRWDINDEGLFIAFGMELYGYSFGIGQSVFFMNEEDINNHIRELLIGLGGGPEYVKGLVEHAHSTFHKADTGLYSQLVEVGWQHFSDTDLKILVDSIFANAQHINK